MSEIKVDVQGAQGAIEVWTIDGEGRRNAIRKAMLLELEQLVTRVSTKNSPVRAVVITGAGDKAFCSGADLKERAEMKEPEVRAFIEALRRTFRAIEKSDCVFIAALNGAAFGGGTELALACDLRVASPAAEVGLTEVKLGIIPGGGGTQRLPRLIGPGRAKDLILTGRRVSSAEAFSFGLVNRLAPEGRLIETAISLAEAIVINAPKSIAAAKHSIQDGLGHEIDDALAIEQRHYESLLNSNDRIEGLKAFAEKRPPQFTGS